MKTIGKAILLSVLVISLASCNTFAPKPTETPTPTETSLPTSTSTPEPTNITPTAIVIPTTTIMPTATINSCTDRGWADISTYITEFQYQTGNFANGVIVSEYLKTLRSIREKIVNVMIDVCTEHARELVLSSMDNRISAQEMMMTGNFNDPNALTNALMQEGPMMEAANAELASLGLQVILPMPGSVPVTLPSTPSVP